MKKIVMAITGASGVSLGLELLRGAQNLCEIHAVFSQNSKKVLELEQGLRQNLDGINAKFYDDSDISAPIASGSFGIDAMIIAPCSINTLAKISCGLSDTLILRAAAVMLKERKKLVLGVREMPLSTISLRQMSELSSMGVVIAPPILGYYAQIKTLEDMSDFIIGKWLDALDVKNEIYKRWKA
ncbi:MAG: UbiX family flavin prenyltransferase [Campylobacter sp.]|nr:UbiX family flavin prenyltransferase [Campylobacter sp.]